jgi:hypothetical protein
MADHIIDDHRAPGPTAPDSPPSPVDVVLYAREFELLLQLGRTKGFLEQDGLMSVLRSVELSPDLIIDVVMRVRAEGIEFHDAPGDTEDLTSVPPTTAVLEQGVGTGSSTENGSTPATGSLTGNGTAPASAVELPEGVVSPATAPAAPKPPPARKPNASRSKDRASNRSSTDGARVDNGYAGGDRFAGPGADPVHTYLKEIGKVRLLDAALEVELAQRILAGTEAAGRLELADAGSETDGDRTQASDRALVRRGQAAK